MELEPSHMEREIQKLPEFMLQSAIPQSHARVNPAAKNSPAGVVLVL